MQSCWVQSHDIYPARALRRMFLIIQAHVLSPVSGDKCVLCIPGIPSPKASPSNTTVPAAIRVDLIQDQPVKRARVSSDASDLSLHLQGDSPAKASDVNDDESVGTPGPDHSVVDLDASKSSHCLQAADPSQSESVPVDATPVSVDYLSYATRPHILGAMDYPESSTRCFNRRTNRGLDFCSHFKTKFNSTNNSKRRVQTMLFWKRHLGISFPITDEMLRDEAWKNLESCDYGIK